MSNLLRRKHIFWYHHNKQWMFHGTFNCYPLYDLYHKCTMFVPVSICLIACCYTMNQGSPFREPPPLPPPYNGRQTMWGKCVNSKSEWNNACLFTTSRQLCMKRNNVFFLHTFGKAKTVSRNKRPYVTLQRTHPLSLQRSTNNVWQVCKLQVWMEQYMFIWDF